MRALTVLVFVVSGTFPFVCENTVWLWQLFAFKAATVSVISSSLPIFANAADIRVIVNDSHSDFLDNKMHRKLLETDSSNEDLRGDVDPSGKGIFCQEAVYGALKAKYSVKSTNTRMYGKYKWEEVTVKSDFDLNNKKRREAVKTDFQSPDQLIVLGRNASSLVPDKPVYVSIATVSFRKTEVLGSICTLLDGLVVPTHIYLFISRRKHLMDDGILPESIPQVLLWLSHQKKLTIVYTDNIGPHRKLLPLLRRHYYSNDDNDVLIANVDDDMAYRQQSSLLYALLTGFQQSDGQSVVALRSRRVGYCNAKPYRLMSSYISWRLFPTPGRTEMLLLPTGNGGILYRPRFFHKVVFDSKFWYLTSTADDLSFRLACMANNVSVHIGCRGFVVDGSDAEDCPVMPYFLPVTASNTTNSSTTTTDITDASGNVSNGHAAARGGASTVPIAAAAVGNAYLDLFALNDYGVRNTFDMRNIILSNRGAVHKEKHDEEEEDVGEQIVEEKEQQQQDQVVRANDQGRKRAQRVVRRTQEQQQEQQQQQQQVPEEEEEEEDVLDMPMASTEDNSVDSTGQISSNTSHSHSYSPGHSRSPSHEENSRKHHHHHLGLQSAQHINDSMDLADVIAAMNREHSQVKDKSLYSINSKNTYFWKLGVEYLAQKGVLNMHKLVNNVLWTERNEMCYNIRHGTSLEHNKYLWYHNGTDRYFESDSRRRSKSKSKSNKMTTTRDIHGIWTEKDRHWFQVLQFCSIYYCPGGGGSSSRRDDHPRLPMTPSEQKHAARKNAIAATKAEMKRIFLAKYAAAQRKRTAAAAAAE